MTDEVKQTVQVGDAVSLEDIERAHIAAVLKTAPSLGQAAKTLGIDPATLWRKRQKYNL